MSDLPKINGMEPTERDPCMKEDCKDNRKKTNFFNRYRNEISDRSGLSHKGVYIVSGIVIFAFVVLVVMIALAAAWPRIPHKHQFPICKDAQCLRAAAQIQESLDDSVSPCDNLWHSTCGGWLRKNPLPKDKSIWNPKQQLVRKEAERVRDLIATLKQPLRARTIEWNLKRFYESCMDVEELNTKRAQPLTDIISELGGWYILKNWNEEDFDKNSIFQKLHDTYGVFPYFKISVEPNPMMPGLSTIRISPSGLGLPDKEYYYREDDRIQLAYKEYIRDVVLYLSTTRNEATKFATDIFFYEKRIAEVTPDAVSLLNPITTYNAISLSELKETNLIPFFDIIQAMYPKSNITEHTEVIVSSQEYLNDIARIIATTDRRTMNGYLMWTLVRKYIPFLSGECASAKHTFDSELFGIQTPPERWEFCSKLVNNYMGLATNSFLERNNPISEGMTKMVNNVFISIISIVKSKIHKFEQSGFLYEHLKAKLEHLRLQIGIPDKVKTEKYLKDYYTKLRIIRANLFDSINNIVEFQKERQEIWLKESLQEESILHYALAETPRVQYSTWDHTVIIPRALLQEPFLELAYPRPLVYGRLGVEIAEAVMSSILPYGSLWTAEKKILSPYHMTVNESIKSAQSSQKCLWNYLMNLNLKVITNEIALKTLIHLYAVDVAEQALVHSEVQIEHIHQPSLEHYEDSALFFISYAQTQCSESTSQNQVYKNTVDFELSQRSRLHLVWAHLKSFSESLECTDNTKLKCPDVF